MIADKDLLSIQQARILAENAHEAQKHLQGFSQAQLDAIVERVADEVMQHAEALAVMSQEETDCGNWTDKCLKNKFVCTAVRRHIQHMECVGVIRRDPERQLMDIGVPVGVIAAICPVTSPVSTTIYKTLIAIKSGNAIIFSPHPRALKSMSRVLDIMMASAKAAGLPDGCLAYMNTITKSGTLELINHQYTCMVLLTGVPGIYQHALCGGKPIIYGGVGNGPVFIERTANVEQAVKNIVTSKTFDNGIAPSAEQSVVIDSPISSEAKAAFLKYGAYYMNEQEAGKISRLFFHTDGRMKKDSIGLDAPTLAKRAGISVPDNVSLLLLQRDYVAAGDPYSKGFLAPILPVYLEDDWQHACERCIELLLYERKARILAIHSNDEEVIRQFALRKPVARILVNTPACFGAMGMTTNLFPAMTLGSGSAGHGITADNVSPMNLIYIRKVGYGIRNFDDISFDDFESISITRPTAPSITAAHSPSAPRTGNAADKVAGNDAAQILQRLLTQVIEGMDSSLIK